jgi:sugar phosphate isomerase/epimerase
MPGRCRPSRRAAGDTGDSGRVSGWAVSVADLVGRAPPPDWLEHVRRTGAPLVELWLPWHVSLERVEEVGRRLEQLDVAVACISSPSFLHGDDGRGAALVAESIEVAAALGAGVVNTYFGHGGDGDDRAAAQRYCRLVGDLVGAAERRGVTITLENEFDAFGHDPEHFDISRRAESLELLVDLVASPSFRLNLDPANLLCAGEDVEAAAARLAPLAGYVHVKDVKELGAQDVPDPRWQTFSDGQRRFQMTRMGEGAVPWRSVMKHLHEAGYDGTFTVEPHCERSVAVEEIRASVACLGSLARDVP